MKQLVNHNQAKFLAVAMVLLSCTAIRAQVRTFKWSDALCDYRGTYDAKKYTPVQLKNTLKLLSPGEFEISTDATVFKIGDITKLSLSKLDTEYGAKLAELSKLKIVGVPYWEKQREMKLRELRQRYELSRITIRAYTDPAAAFAEKFEGAERCYAEFAGPIAKGSDDLLAVWLRVNEASRARNSDPTRIKHNYDEQYASPDREKYALVEVMAFGWWNCANEAIKYVEYDGNQEKEFKRLFSRVTTLSCDEP